MPSSAWKCQKGTYLDSDSSGPIFTRALLGCITHQKYYMKQVNIRCLWVDIQSTFSKKKKKKKKKAQQSIKINSCSDAWPWFTMNLVVTNILGTVFRYGLLLCKQTLTFTKISRNNPEVVHFPILLFKMNWAKYPEKLHFCVSI